MVLLLLLFVTACQSTDDFSEIEDEKPETQQENVGPTLDDMTLKDDINIEKRSSTVATVEDSREKDVPSLPKKTITPCQPGWKCLSSTLKIRLLANCSFGERQSCTYGCANESCNPPPVCEPGWKCKGSMERGYQENTCDWIQETKCEYGCFNATCQAKPNETTTPAEVMPSDTSPPRPSVSIIKVGEVQEITANGGVHNLSVGILEPERVRMSLDGFRSDWLSDGQSFTFGSGVTIKVHTILFQGFAGGKREVEYTVS